MPRQNNLDLLRIHATFEVILYHTTSRTSNLWKPNRPFFVNLINTMSCSNNYFFILLSSFVGANSKLALSKLAPLLLQTLFYSIFKEYFVKKYFLMQPTYLFEYYLYPQMNSVFWYTAPFLFAKLVISLVSKDKLSRSLHLKISFIYCWWSFLMHQGYYDTIGFKNSHCAAPFIAGGFVATFIAYYGNEISLKLTIPMFILAFRWNFHIHEKFRQIPHFETFPSLNELLNIDIFGLPSFLIAVTFFHIVTRFPFTLSQPYSSIIANLAEMSFAVFLSGDGYTLLWGFRLWDIYRYKRTEFPYVQILLKGALKLFIVSSIIEFVRKKIFNLFIFRRKYYSYITRLIDYEF